VNVEITEELKTRAKNVMLCADCGGYNESYMVHNELWKEAWPTHGMDRAQLKETFLSDGYTGRFWLQLCLSCLAGRLHRPLTINDFSQALINEPIRFGYFMGQKSMR